MPSLERDPQSYVEGDWTDVDRALHEGYPGYAYVDSSSQIAQFFSFGITSIPSSGIAVDGFEILVDASKDETDGSGNLAVGVELSWDGGSSFTSTSYNTSALTTSNARSTLGGPTNTWGRSWTRSELDSMRVRITSEGTGVLDNPQWRVDHVAVVFYWSSTSNITLTIREQLPLVDSETISRQVLRIHETLSLADGGLTPGSEWVDLS